MRFLAEVWARQVVRVPVLRPTLAGGCFVCSRDAALRCWLARWRCSDRDWGLRPNAQTTYLVKNVGAQDW